MKSAMAVQTTPESTPRSMRLRVWLSAVVLVTLAVFAYENSFRAPFVFDDDSSIRDNPSIRSLATAFTPDLHSGETASGRPLLNLSLALSYRLSGSQPWGYHALNFLIHLAAGLTLFGLVRRTLHSRAPGSIFATHSLPLAAISAALWMLHPLATESVTYIIQRAESLAALFYLLTLYSFIRGTEMPDNTETKSAKQKNLWLVASVLCCWLGMAAKETMVSAPLVVLLYDRVFITPKGSFRTTLRAQAGYYAALFASWILLATLVLASASRGTTAGFSSGVSAWHYALTQCYAIITYIKLSIWPASLVFDYGTGIVTSLAKVWPYALAVTALAIATLWALRRKLAAGFLGAAFLAILAPSTSIVPIATQTMAEHRMYLPLAAIIIGAVMLVAQLLRYKPAARVAAFAVATIVACVFAMLTHQRNNDYREVVTIWADTASKVPENFRALSNYGTALVDAGRAVEGERYCREALRLKPDYPEALNNLGHSLERQKRPVEAERCYAEAVHLMRASHTPDIVPVLYNHASVLYAMQRTDEARAAINEALSCQPGNAETLIKLGDFYYSRGLYQEACPAYERAAAAAPDSAYTQYALGNTLLAIDATSTEAEKCYRRALALDPTQTPARENLARLLLYSGRPAEALPLFATVIGETPTSDLAWLNYGMALYKTGDTAKAIQAYRENIRLAPDDAEPRNTLASMLASTGQIDEAVKMLESAIVISPAYAEAHNNLANALMLLNRPGEAIFHYEKALELNPNLEKARINKARALEKIASGIDAPQTSSTHIVRVP